MKQRIVIFAVLLCLATTAYAAVTISLVDGKIAMSGGKIKTTLTASSGWTDPDNPLILYQWDQSQTNLTGFDNVGSLSGLDAEIDLGSSSDVDRLQSNDVWYIKLDGTDFTTTKGFPAAITGLPTYTISWWIRFPGDANLNQAMWSWTTNQAGFETFHEVLADSIGLREMLKAVLTTNDFNLYSMETPENTDTSLFLSFSNWAHFAVVQANDGKGLQYYANGNTNVNGFTTSNNKNGGMREIFDAAQQFPVDRMTIGGLQGASLAIAITADFGRYAFYGTNLNTLSISNQYVNSRTNEVIR